MVPNLSLCIITTNKQNSLKICDPEPSLWPPANWINLLSQLLNSSSSTSSTNHTPITTELPLL